MRSAFVWPWVVSFLFGLACVAASRAASAHEGGPPALGPTARLADAAALLPAAALGIALAVASGRLRAQRLAAEEDRRAAWAALETASDGLLAFDEQGRIGYACPKAGMLFRSKPDELIGREGSDLIPPSESDKNANTAGGRVTGRRKGGGTIPLDVRSGSQVTGEGGKRLTPLFLHDATHSRQTHEMLNAREAHLRLVVERMPAILWTTDRTLRITSTRGAGLAALNMRPEEVIGMTMLECLDNTNVESTPIAAHLRAVGGESLCYEMVWKGRTFQVRVDPLRNEKDGTIGTVGILIDVTERKQALAELKARERQQAAVARLGLRALAGMDLPALMQEAAEAVTHTLDVEFCKLVEHRPEAAPVQVRAGHGWGGTPPQTTPGADHQAEFTLRSGGPVVSQDLRSEDRFNPSPSLLAGGAVSGISVPVQGKHGPLGVLGAHAAAHREFTPDDLNFLQGVANVVAAAIERRRADEAQGRLVAILEATPDVVAIARQDRRLDYLNRAGRELLGLRPGEPASTRTLADLHPPQARGQDLAGRLRCAEHRGVWSGEADILGPGGEAVLASQVLIAHRAAGGPVGHYSIIARDLTERLSLEEQIRQSQKMDAIGKLAGGIAHDFNNLLCVITGFTTLALRQVPNGSPLCVQLEEVCKAGERAASLTRQLLAFSRKQMLAPQEISLNSLVSDLERMLRRLIGEDIRLTTKLDPAAQAVKADPGQLEQVVMNLCVNARDAMPGGGRLTITTANVALEAEALEGNPEVRPGQYVMLAVSDNGCGMPPEVLARIWEPFYTTKPVGKGTGLGLSTVYGIVKQSGGHVEAESHPGQGTTFRIYLPRFGGASPLLSEANAVAAAGGRETVLVVEDEEGVRSLAAQVLRAKGYSVLEAHDGEGALAACKAHPGDIDLVLTDAVMPNLSGGELARRLSVARPGTKVLFMSGFTDSALIRHGVATGEVDCLLKPFTPESLAESVRRVLDGKSLALV